MSALLKRNHGCNDYMPNGTIDNGPAFYMPISSTKPRAPRRSIDATPLKSFPLDRLPMELQLQVLRDCLVTPQPALAFEIPKYSHSKSSIRIPSKDKYAINTSILQTCRMFNVEGTKLFYSQNTFILNPIKKIPRNSFIINTSEVVPESFFNGTVGCLSAQDFGSIRHLELQRPLSWEGIFPRGVEEIEKNLSYFPNLETLVVSFSIPIDDRARRERIGLSTDAQKLDLASERLKQTEHGSDWVDVLVRDGAKAKIPAHILAYVMVLLSMTPQIQTLDFQCQEPKRLLRVERSGTRGVSVLEIASEINVMKQRRISLAARRLQPQR